MNLVDGPPIEILLVEDNVGDVRLTQEAFKDGRIANRLSVVRDGVEAVSFLRRHGPYVDAPRPDLILLDWNLPRKNGREVLAEIKADHDLHRIPVVVLTTSESEEDIYQAYDLHANCYISKPVELEKFLTVVQAIEGFWLTIVRMPQR